MRSPQFRLLLCTFSLLFGLGAVSRAQSAPESVARLWNEQLLQAIRGDFARPTVHARNLLHTSIALYDSYAVYGGQYEPVLLGKTFGSQFTPRPEFAIPADVALARRTTMSYAAYRLIRHRFGQSPGRRATYARVDSLMNALGHNTQFRSTDFSGGDPAALGNWIAEQIIEFGFTDGANEDAGYAPIDYAPVNPPLVVNEFGNPDVVDIDRWQPLSLNTFIDQSGNVIPGSQQTFIGPEWGSVVPFALRDEDLTLESRDGLTWRLYHDPGPPPTMADPDTRAFFQRANEMVIRWSALLDPRDTTTIDISPATMGDHLRDLPERDDYWSYYREVIGGDEVGGLSLNPATGLPYAPNRVRQADYYRVLAEFWADGPDSETPPGHWFTILNYVLDQPETVMRWRGQGPELSREAYTLQAYLSLAGAVHDAAIAAWGAKGYYDASRPVSVIRYMAEKGQRSDPNLPRYHPEGLALIPGQAELVLAGDPLAGDDGEYVNEVKVRAWRAHDAIGDPLIDAAGVDWVLAKAWWPYQLRTFVSPPFAGYVSGHSTFSRAAAEVMTHFTGSAYFPGGLGTFDAPRRTFLKFESGPSEDLQLTWATYRGAADEVSLSRIYGGIHAPYDDLPGREIGIAVGLDAVSYAEKLFDNVAPQQLPATVSAPQLGLGPTVASELTVTLNFTEAVDQNRFSWSWPEGFDADAAEVLAATWTSDRSVEIELAARSAQEEFAGVRLSLVAEDLYGNRLVDALTVPLFDYVPLSVSVASEGVNLRVRLAPNPANDFVSLYLPDGTIATDVRLYDLAGREVLVVAERGVTGFDVSRLPTGSYVTLVTDSEGRVARSLLVRG